MMKIRASSDNVNVYRKSPENKQNGDNISAIGRLKAIAEKEYPFFFDFPGQEEEISDLSKLAKIHLATSSSRKKSSRKIKGFRTVSGKLKPIFA